MRRVLNTTTYQGNVSVESTSGSVEGGGGGYHDHHHLQHPLSQLVAVWCFLVPLNYHNVHGE